VAVTLATIGSSRPLPVSVEVGLYRVAQEAVTNALRHANPTRVQLTLTATPAAVLLIIADDGAGFDPQGTPPDRYGLRGMNERVRLLGGSLHVRSAPGAGTQIEASVPLEG
jgi:signal transduction histidine kinase